MKFNIKKFKRDGYFIIKNIIKPSKIKKFNQEISQITKIISKENKSSSKKFAEAFENSKKRSIFYNLMQNTKIVREITNDINFYFEKNKIYNLLNFKIPSITNALIISLPGETKNLNPLHQDIYNFFSFNFFKIWIPMTKVDEKHGSMEMFKGSNALGYIKPKFINKYCTYPEIDKKIVKNYKSEILKLHPGSVVLFDPLIIHRSLKNKSNKVRFNIGIDIQDIKSTGDQSVIDQMIKVRKERKSRREALIS
tara:strand:+ start:1124 stop:1879 length:756 start_codon:yes stop_codon:yes gene_type:complete